MGSSASCCLINSQRTVSYSPSPRQEELDKDIEDVVLDITSNGVDNDAVECTNHDIIEVTKFADERDSCLDTMNLSTSTEEDYLLVERQILARLKDSDAVKAFHCQDHVHRLIWFLSRRHHQVMSGDDNISHSFIPQKSDSIIGAHNRGLWKLTVNENDVYLVKLVEAPDNETVSFMRIIEKYPTLLKDPRLSIPLDILQVVDSQDVPLYYVHVSRWIEAKHTLADLMMDYWILGRKDLLFYLVSNFQRFLMKFKVDYPFLSHNDLTPTNVLIKVTMRDENSGQSSTYEFVLVDCTGMDESVTDAYGGYEDEDSGSFMRSIDFLGVTFGPVFTAIVYEAFNSGGMNIGHRL